MNATLWFIAGLLAGAAAMLGGMLLWNLSREETLRSRKVLFAGGLTAAAIAAVAAGMSLAISSGSGPAAVSDDPALAGSPPASTAMPASSGMPPSAPMASSSAMPPASMMAQILSTPGSARPGTAQPMDQAAADLAARLKSKGGTAADWNLLAQAYDFLGRPADAQRARAQAAKVGAAKPKPAR
jgi:hypothetical protein